LGSFSQKFGQLHDWITEMAQNSAYNDTQPSATSTCQLAHFQ